MHPSRVRSARMALAVLAGLGLLACWVVAANNWEGWDSRPSPAGVVLDLGVAAAWTVLAMTLAAFAPRWLSLPVALLHLLWGWFGTWAYGFLWVPGAASVIACLLPRARPPFPTGPARRAPA